MLVFTYLAAKEPVVLSRTVTGKWVDDVVTPWDAVKQEHKAPFSKIPGQAFNYAKVCNVCVWPLYQHS